MKNTTKNSDTPSGAMLCGAGAPLSMHRANRIQPSVKKLRSRTTSLLLAAAVGFFSACEVGPDYKRPELNIPTTYKSTETQPSTQSATEPSTQSAATQKFNANWWTLFNDPGLNALETSALKSNPDIQAAVARVIQARAASRVTASQFYPIITADPSITRSRTPNLNTNGNSINGNTTSGSRTVTQTTVPFDLGYEVDIWGRVRRSVEQSNAQTRLSLDDYGVVLLTLTAEIAQDYYTLRSLDSQDEILNRSVDLYKQQRDLVNTQYKAGIVGQTGLAQVESLLENTRVIALDLRRQRADLEHALAILTGLPPSALSLGHNPLDNLPPIIPPGLPADLLAQRPDVAEAEENLIAANAGVGVAKADFYPKLTLTSAAGFESLDVEHTFDWENRFWSIGPALSAPIFEGGRLTASLEQSKAVYDERLATYRSTLLGAFRDVEDSLTDLHLRAKEADAQDKAVASSKAYVRLSQIEYKAGSISLLQIIDADRTLLSDELSDQQILNQRLSSTILLIKALGGGWTPDVSQNATSQPAQGPEQTPKQKN